MKSLDIYNETLKDKLTLSPLEKYQKYDRWPNKLVIGIALAILTSVQAVFLSTRFAFNNPFQMQAWVSLFLNDEDPTQTTEAYYTIQDFQESLKDTLEGIKSLEENSISYVSTKYSDFIIFVNYLFPYETENEEKMNFQYKVDINQGIYCIKEPFDMDDSQSIKEFWLEANAFTLQMNNIQVFSHNQKSICWHININYVYKDYGYIVAQIISNGAKCSDEYNNRLLLETMNLSSDEKGFWIGYDGGMLQVIIMLLALIDLILSIKYIYEVIGIYTKNISEQKRKLPPRMFSKKTSGYNDITTLKLILKEQKPWSRLTIREKLFFFDLFLPIRILGNFLQIIGSGLLLADGLSSIESFSHQEEYFVGIKYRFGCFFAWFSILKYLEYNERLHVIANVLESSMIPLTLAIINFLPVFFAYVFLGICLFNESSRFENILSACTSLIALIYGDSVADIILKSSQGTNTTLALIYMVSYILFFIIAVNNIMVALVKEQHDQKVQLMNREKQLMNEFDITSSNFQPPKKQEFPVKPPQVIQLKEQKSSSAQHLDLDADGNKLNRSSEAIFKTFRSDLSNEDKNKESQKQTIKLKTAQQMANVIQKAQGAHTKVSQQTLAQDWNKLAAQELRQNYIFNALASIIQLIKNELSDMEKELWNDIEYCGLNQEEQNEVLKFYSEALIQLNMKLRTLYNKGCQVQLQWSVAKKTPRKKD